MYTMYICIYTYMRGSNFFLGFSAGFSGFSAGFYTTCVYIHKTIRTKTIRTKHFPALN